MAEKTNDVQRNWLQAYYKETVVPALIKEFNYTNINQVPKIEKIVLNMGLGDVRDNAKSLQLAVDELKSCNNIALLYDTSLADWCA